METQRETVLLCLSGLDSDAFLDHALRRLPGPGRHFVLLYVVDTRPVDELGYRRQALFRGRLSPERLAQLDTVADSAAGDVLDEARTYLVRHCPAALVETRVARGRPEREIVQVATQLPCHLVVIGTRPGGRIPVPHGPASIGHVARFVLDHAPCDVLLLR